MRALNPAEELQRNRLVHQIEQEQNAVARQRIVVDQHKIQEALARSAVMTKSEADTPLDKEHKAAALNLAQLETRKQGVCWSRCRSR